jgi:hypothetical protein
LEESVIGLQKVGRHIEVPGTTTWVHTLRAEQVPQLRFAATEMWAIIGKGTPFMYEAARLYENMTGRTLLLYNDLGTAYLGFWSE